MIGHDVVIRNVEMVCDTFHIRSWSGCNECYRNSTFPDNRENFFHSIKEMGLGNKAVN